MSVCFVRQGPNANKIELCSYDATENILTQCLDNSAGSGLTGDPNGSWKLGDEWYWITMNRSIGALPNEEFADMQNGVPIEGYVPQQCCLPTNALMQICSTNSYICSF